MCLVTGPGLYCPESLDLGDTMRQCDSRCYFRAENLRQRRGDVTWTGHTMADVGVGLESRKRDLRAHVLSQRVPPGGH